MSGSGGPARRGCERSVGVYGNQEIIHDFAGGADEAWFSIDPATACGRKTISKGHKSHLKRLANMKPCVETHLGNCVDNAVKVRKSCRPPYKLGPFDTYLREKADMRLHHLIQTVESGIDSNLPVHNIIQKHRQASSKYTPSGVRRPEKERQQAWITYRRLNHAEQQKHRESRLAATNPRLAAAKKRKAVQRSAAHKVPAAQTVETLEDTLVLSDFDPMVSSGTARSHSSSYASRAMTARSSRTHSSRPQSAHSSRRPPQAISFFVPGLQPTPVLNSWTADITF